MSGPRKDVTTFRDPDDNEVYLTDAYIDTKTGDDKRLCICGNLKPWRTDLCDQCEELRIESYRRDDEYEVPR